MAIKILALSIVFALASILSAVELSPEPITYSAVLPLIHRDASDSPLYDPKLSRYDRIKSAIARSIVRAEFLFNNTMESPPPSHNANLSEMISTRGEYFINISIGTPPIPFLAMIDTYSKDNWLECKFCEDCDDQNQKLFDPIKSSTFQPTLHPSDSDPINNTHDLYTFYGRNNELSFQETISCESLKFPKLSCNCKFVNQGTFSSIGSGVTGLLLNNQQPDVPRFQDSIDGRFAYYLAPLGAANDSITDTIRFGEYADISLRYNDVVSTPIVTDGNVTKGVKLTLKAITVGEKRIEWNTKPKVGNIFIDISTTLLMLQSMFYDAIESEIRNQVNATRVDDPLSQLKLCYNSDGFKAPKLFMNFNGAKIELNDYNAWVATSDSVVCFAAAPANITIYGNLAQRTFWIRHNMKESTVYFKSSKKRF